MSEFSTLLDFSVWEAMCILIATNIKFYSNATTTSQTNNDKILFCKKFVAVLILLIQVKEEYLSKYTKGKDTPGNSESTVMFASIKFITLDTNK